MIPRAGLECDVFIIWESRLLGGKVGWVGGFVGGWVDGFIGVVDR